MATNPGKPFKQAARNLKGEVRDFKKEQAYLMFRALAVIEAATKANIRANFTTRTGTLLNSPEKEVVIEGNEVHGILKIENVPYAAVQEFGSEGLPGGKITPKNGRYLAIPTENVTGPDGIARISPREIPDAVFIPSERGGLLMGVNIGDQFLPMFILKESVTIPARPYLRPALEKYQKDIAKRFELFLEGHFNFKE